jgi:glucosylceramidase
MTSFVQNHLGPKLEADGKGDVKILGYDQNRADLKDWVDEMYKDKEASKYFSGTAVHWYESMKFCRRVAGTPTIKHQINI